MEAVQKHRGILWKVQMGRDVTEPDQGSGEEETKEKKKTDEMREETNRKARATL